MSEPKDPAKDPPKDPIAFELFKNAIFSIADEMALMSSHDHSGRSGDNMELSRLADAQGKLVAQASSAGHLGSVADRANRSYGTTATT
jgi:N-methylhydantoinase B